MRKYLSLILPVLFLCSSCGPKDAYLLKIYEGPSDEFGVPTGYVNQTGDTVIPFGTFAYCFTDTLRNYGIVIDLEDRCIAIDRDGKELYEVYWYDNGPDYLNDGLFRIVRNGKIGYANEAGKVVVEPAYACAQPFREGIAMVSDDCELRTVGEHQQMEGASWYAIDRRGNVVQKTN